MSDINIIEINGPTRDGGSCSICGSDYRGRPYQEQRGKRALVRLEPGLIEPVNLCSDCAEGSR